ncbi:hypothetical protein VCHE09_3180, partial [Vibrio paracholerae HE-09]
MSLPINFCVARLKTRFRPNP